MVFGEYLRQLRESRSLRQKDIAESLGVSTVYVCDIEKGRRNPPSADKITVIAQVIGLSDKESSMLFDLAGSARGNAAPDLIEYLNKNPNAKAAIRRIIGQKLDYDWSIIP